MSWVFVEAVVAARLPAGSLLNINLPEAGLDRWAWTRQGKRTYAEKVEERLDPRGRKYYWIGGAENAHENIAGSDCNAIYDDKIVSVTPLKLDLTHPSLAQTHAGMDVAGFGASHPGGPSGEKR